MVAAMLAAAALFAASWQPAPLVRVRHQRALVLETVRTPLERVSTQRAPAVEMLLPKARLPPTTRRPTLTTWHPTTHHLAPATHHLGPPSHHLPPITYHSPPATYPKAVAAVFFLPALFVVVTNSLPDEQRLKIQKSPMLQGGTKMKSMKTMTKQRPKVSARE